MYGRGNYSNKGRTTRRTNGYTSRGRGTAYKKMGSRKTKYRSSTGYRLSRKEIKYDDDYLNLRHWDKTSHPGGANGQGFSNWILGGTLNVSVASLGNTGAFTPNVTGINSLYSTQPFHYKTPNCLSNVISGTTAKTRIGNLIQPRFITIKGVMAAAKTNYLEDAETLGKIEEVQSVEKVLERFVRTSIKVFVIRDKSMNEKGYVAYNDVFETPDETTLGYTAASNPFLWNRKVDAIARYEIIKQLNFELDADDPQKAFDVIIPLKGIGIRYNGSANTTTVRREVNSPDPLTIGAYSGPTQVATATGNAQFRFSHIDGEHQSMTNGIYIMAVAHSSLSGDTDANNMSSPSLVLSSRLTFEDN